LNEWITHYVNEGIDKIFLIDNCSTDDYKPILEPFINSGIVELIIDNRRYSQALICNSYIEKYKHYEWTLHCDLDEFIYSRKGFKTIKEYLKSVHNDTSQICIPWKMFGSNGYDTLEKEQPKSVIHSFNKRGIYDFSKRIEGTIGQTSYCKSIFRTNLISKMDVHEHEMIRGNTDKLSSSSLAGVLTGFVPTHETLLTEMPLHLNHYAIQSLTWFLAVKATRGDNCAEFNNNVRNINYFKSYDHNDIIDDELADKTY
jgi:hypothetical protein